MIANYIRVSTTEQNTNRQENTITERQLLQIK
jgi:DNA invertase Pin-like site-specific DNA recombinase